MLVRSHPAHSNVSSSYSLKPKFSIDALTKTRAMASSDVHSLRRKRNAKNLALHLETPAIALLKQADRDTHSHSAPATPGLGSMPFTPVSADTGVIGYSESTYKHEPMNILPGLYLGDEHNAANGGVLERLGIRYILNVAREVENPYRPRAASVASGLELTDVSRVASRPLRAISFDHLAPAPVDEPAITVTSGTHAITYKKFAWTHSQNDLSDYFEQAFVYLDQAREAGHAVLVHCQLGVSRSATLVIAYVMRTLRLNAQAAYQFVKAKSPNVCPNLNLMYQLIDLEKKLQLTTSAFAISQGSELSSAATTPPPPPSAMAPTFQFPAYSLPAKEDSFRPPSPGLSVDGSERTLSDSRDSSARNSPVDVKRFA
ncbi:hypothetical protein IWQ60_005946 [Tieghemiomyces parasiticus]|uniref:protein-tyrosine-phosphatase n=1 Tax=Tieghemiomyces parasiticus TaxID=78921 RepID=A0A9W8A591_9FUNG|nr:hypothetical protein IWQ60_005946 [Tieghemiomyces parasiticus]